MNFKVANFQRGVRDSRSLFTRVALRGGPIEPTEIVDAYIERDGGAGVDTGIVASHIAQMKLFGVGQGVEFFPSQDNFGAQRKDFIDKVIDVYNLSGNEIQEVKHD